MYAIPVNEQTLDLIEVLNDGVRPEVESEDTYFLYTNENEHAQIVTLAQLQMLNGIWSTIEILFTES